MVQCFQRRMAPAPHDVCFFWDVSPSTKTSSALTIQLVVVLIAGARLETAEDQANHHSQQDLG